MPSHICKDSLALTSLRRQRAHVLRGLLKKPHTYHCESRDSGVKP
jgi:hypothetical protein